MTRRIVTALVLVAVLAIAVIGTGADAGSKGKEIEIAFDNAFGLTEGGDFRVAGVRAGSTPEMKTSKGPECQNRKPNGPPRTCAIVVAKITQPGFKSFREDSQCEIRQQSLIGEYYVDCQPGNGRKLRDGERIPVQRTASTVPTDLVNNVLRRPYRERLRLILAELGTGLAGRPDDLAEVLRRAHPGLRETRKVLQILGNQKQIIRDFIADSDTVVAELDDKKRELARWITETGRTSEISASRRDALAAGLHRFPTLLDELKPTMLELGKLTDAQTPVLRQLQAAAPDLTEFFTRLGPFAEASRPAFASLGKAAKVGNEAFVESREEIDELRKVADGAPKLGKPLRQMLQTLDDRDRAIDADRRAAESAPPPPDPNSDAKGKGFTGFESLLNYVYWQALAVNEFDEIGHSLRVVGHNILGCSDFQNDLRGPEMGGTKEQEALRKRCNSYTGPYQPGITAPDPTDPDGGVKDFFDGPSTASARSAIKPTRPKSKGERRGAGDPRALPLPGQFDPSVPHVTLPPAIQELVDELRSRGGSAPTSIPSGPAPEQMLDFLLSP